MYLILFCRDAAQADRFCQRLSGFLATKSASPTGRDKEWSVARGDSDPVTVGLRVVPSPGSIGSVLPSDWWSSGAPRVVHSSYFHVTPGAFHTRHDTYFVDSDWEVKFDPLMESIWFKYVLA